MTPEPIKPADNTEVGPMLGKLLPEEPPKVELNLSQTSDDNLKEIARDLKEGRIFTDRHMREGDGKMLPMVFMPIAMGAMEKCSKEDVAEIGLIYEHLSEASPRSCNGYPVFFSMHLLSRSDSAKMFEWYDQLVAAEKQVLEG